MMKRLLYKGEPILTFRMIDELHERKEGTTRRNYSNNIEYFEEGKHYYKAIEGCAFDELNEYTNRFITNIDRGWKNLLILGEETTQPQKNQILITQRGYLLLVKSLNDERAWKIQDALIDGYFDMKQLLIEQHKQALIPYNQKIETLQLEIKGLKRQEEFAHKSSAEIQMLRNKLAIYESDYITILDAFVQYGQGLKLKNFREYLSKIKWKKRTNVIDGKNVIEVYKQGLEFRIQMFIAQCKESSITKGLFSHPAINGMFEMRELKPKSLNKPRK